MRVLAATFEGEEAARTVLDALRRRFQLTGRDASVAPLGTDRPERSLYVLAGRFYEQRVSEVRNLIAAHGGRVVQEIDEARTLPVRPSPPGQFPGAGRTFGTQTWRATKP